MFNKIVMVLCAAFVLSSAPALADDRRERGRGHPQWSHGHDGKHWDGKHWDRKHWNGDRGKHHRHARKHDRRVIWHGHRHWTPPKRHFHHAPRKSVHRHYHHYHRSSHDDWAVYAILALQLVDTLNESQQRSYAWAQQQAVAVPVGESIQWQDSGLYGSVTPVREGNDGVGRYCREFQHQITVGNRQQSGYGIACRQPDGAWEIVS
jgi:hypothetical protein